MAKLLDGTRIYGTANVDTKINVGANVAVNTSVIFVGNSTVNTVISANTITLNGTNLSTAITSNAAAAYTNATAFAANADNISSGTVANARLNSANTTQAGIVQLVDGITNTSIVYAATANSAKVAYDAAIDANTRAASAQTAASDAYTNATAFAANATNISSGTVANARLNSANTTQAGIVQLVDSIANVSITHAGTANSVKTAYDAAISANTRAASAQTEASAAYSNAIAYSANATNLSSGTVANARLNSANTTQAGIVQLVDSVTNTSVVIAATANSVKQSYDAAISANTRAASAQTEATSAYSNAVAYAASNTYVNSTFAPKADPTFTGTVTANNVVITGNLTVNGTTTYVNSTTLNIGDNLITLNADAAGSPTEDAGIQISRGSSANVELLWNETTDKWTFTNDGTNYFNIASNSDVSTAYTNATAFAANADNISSGTVNNARLNSANTTQAGIVQLVDSTSNTSVTIAATANSVKAALDLAVANAATAYTNATSYADTASGTAYTNATAFAANADNISSGTLNTARLPATANVSTAINIGADVGANTTAVRVGNTTITTTDLTLGGTVTANGETGTAGYVLKSGGTANAYWAAAESGGATLVANTTDTQTFYIPMSNATSGSWTNAVIDTALTFVPSTNTLTIGSTLANSTGIYPVSNTAGFTFGSASQRWVITANSGMFSGALNATQLTTTTGVFPSTNTSGQALGGASQRWAIVANTGWFTGQINATSIVTTTGIFPTSNTSGTSMGQSTGRWVVFANTINASANITTTATLFSNSTVGVKSTASISTNTLTLDIAAASLYEVTLNANITTLTINNTQSSGYISNFVLAFVGDGTARTVTWPASVKWPSGTAPTLTSTLNKKDIFVFFTYDGGTSWHGCTVGQNL